MRITPLLLVLCFACSSSSSGNDAGEDASVQRDAAVALDATSPPDSSTLDAAGDSGPSVDAGGADAGDDAEPAFDAGPGAIECSADSPCEGACTGRSCSATWFCVSDLPCTDDLVTYCGCDGTTFSGSSTCPPRPFASMGPCPSRETSCDARGVTCRIPTPVCEEGFVPEVNEAGTCWTMRCVPIGDCGCSSPEECPDNDNYTCRNDTGRCTPFL